MISSANTYVLTMNQFQIINPADARLSQIKLADNTLRSFNGRLLCPNIFL